MPASAGLSGSCAPQKYSFSRRYILTSSDSSCCVKMLSRKSANRLPMPMETSSGSSRPVFLGQAGERDTHRGVSKRAQDESSAWCR